MPKDLASYKNSISKYKERASKYRVRWKECEQDLTNLDHRHSKIVEDLESEIAEQAKTITEQTNTIAKHTLSRDMNRAGVTRIWAKYSETVGATTDEEKWKTAVVRMDSAEQNTKIHKAEAERLEKDVEEAKKYFEDLQRQVKSQKAQLLANGGGVRAPQKPTLPPPASRMFHKPTKKDMTEICAQEFHPANPRNCYDPNCRRLKLHRDRMNVLLAVHPMDPAVIL